MKDDLSDHPAVIVLKEFFGAMNSWEADALQHHESVDWGNADELQLAVQREVQRRHLEAIFAKYCEIGTQAERLQNQGLSFGDPPAYSTDGEEVISVTPKGSKLVIETRQTRPPHWKYRYELVQLEGEWRLRDTRKRSSEKNPTWRRDML